MRMPQVVHIITVVCDQKSGRVVLKLLMIIINYDYDYD
jgi:hypothetical protein